MTRVVSQLFTENVFELIYKELKIYEVYCNYEDSFIYIKLIGKKETNYYVLIINNS